MNKPNQCEWKNERTISVSFLNECHQHITLNPIKNNDDVPVINEIVNMIHENHKFVNAIHSLRRNFDAL